MRRVRKVCLAYDEEMLKHINPGDELLSEDDDLHQERPARLIFTWDQLGNEGIISRCKYVGAHHATLDDLARVHDVSYINSIRNAMDLPRKKKEKFEKELKGESVYFNRYSMAAASLAAGSYIEVCRSIANGEMDSGFALVRPPGHHAERDKAKGFCIFNNVAIAACYLLDNFPGINKILIVDWDVHHGNGTQHIFYDDNRVLYFSIHRYDDGAFYPCSEDANLDKIGSGPGKGYNINVPLSRRLGCGDADYMAVWDQLLIPVVKKFKPDMILISGGFDAAKNDPLGKYRVSANGFANMLYKLMPYAQGKIAIVLEGGYNLTSLSNCVLQCLKTLLGDEVKFEGRNKRASEETKSVIKQVRKQLCKYWDIPQQKFGSELRFSMKKKVHVSPTKQPSSATKSGNSGRRGHVSPKRRSSVGSTPGKKRVSKSKKAGLTFPVARVTRCLKKGSPRLGRTAAVYLTAVLECVAAEVLEMAGNQARSRKKVQILPSDILHCTRMDDEFVKLLADRVIPSAGNFPPRYPESLPKSPKDLDSPRNSPRR